MTLRTGSRSAVLALAALLAGCASAPVNEITPGYEGAPGVETFLAIAPNAALALPAELSGGSGPLREAIDVFLREQGRAVRWLDLYSSSHLWSQSVEQAKEAGEIGRAPGIFAARLAEQFDFQAILMPSILLHTTRVHDSRGRWDGVYRRVRVVNAPRRTSARGQNTLIDGIAAGGAAGDFAVTSVHLMVYSPEGERIFEGRGGLEFVQEIDMSTALQTYHFQVRMRSDLFQDAEVLREGVGIAFTPYLTPTEDP